MLGLCREPTASGVEAICSPGISYLTRKEQKFMRTLAQRFVNFLKREDGPTAVEYAVMLALIIVVCITAITALGTNANKTFSSVSNTIGSTAS
jgi:pilus assembly protein Flp/PilA